MAILIDAEKLLTQVNKKKSEVAQARYTEGFNDAIMRVRSMIHAAKTYNSEEVVPKSDYNVAVGFIEHLRNDKQDLVTQVGEEQQKVEKLKSEVKDLEYKLAGVMHSVDKWLDGEELNQDEVNRAITMREKTLNIIEELTNDRDGFENLFDVSLNVQNRLSAEVEEANLLIEMQENLIKEINAELKQAKQEVAEWVVSELKKSLKLRIYNYRELIRKIEKKYMGE